MRGEQSSASHADTIRIGSSPNARGTVLCRSLQPLFRRFIPACAGNRSAGNPDPSRGAVHPRMRGEQQGGEDAALVVGGSSPHARGTGDCRVSDSHAGRFIPACAGNRRLDEDRDFCGAVHPRMRGEQFAVMFTSLNRVGSSPHARGTDGSRGRYFTAYRFIPACAGNSAGKLVVSATTSVHPRMRGEQINFIGTGTKKDGSSPHARGTDVMPLHSKLRHRFIPACAGNRAQARYPARRKAVHPRMRGEQALNSLANNSEFGSSPHARGTARDPSR